MSGTLDEPEGAPEPRFALQSTVNWMHGLAIGVQSGPIDKQTVRSTYSCVQRGTLTDPAVNTALEQLLMSLHHVSALHEMRGKELDLARVAVMAWYYCVFQRS